MPKYFKDYKYLTFIIYENMWNNVVYMLNSEKIGYCLKYRKDNRIRIKINTDRCNHVQAKYLHKMVIKENVYEVYFEN